MYLLNINHEIMVTFKLFKITLGIRGRKIWKKVCFQCHVKKMYTYHKLSHSILGIFS